MIKYILTFVFSSLLFSVFVHAQKLESEVELLVKSTEYIYSAVDKNDNYVFAFKTKSQYEFVFYTANHQKSGSVVASIPSAQKRDTYLGIQLRGDTCSIYTLSTKSNQIIQLNVGRSGGEISKKIIGQLAYTEKYLKCISLNGAFYILTATQGKNQLDVHAIENDVVTKNTFEVGMTDFYKRLSSGNGLLNEDTQASVGIDAIQYDIENNVKSARATKKIYTFENYIYLIFDDPNYSDVVKIDLKNNSISYKQFLFSLDHGNNSFKKQGNSYLYNQTLFRVTMSMEQMTFTAVNVETNETYATYYATPHNPMNFKNGPIIQENSSDKLRIIDDNAAYFKKVLAGNLSIAVNKKDSSFVVEIGSYEEIVTDNNYNNPSGGARPTISVGMGMGMGMGMGGVGMGMGNMGYGSGMGYGGMYPYNNYGWNSPGYYNGYSGYYPYNSNTTTIRTVYVHSMVNIDSYVHQEGIVPITLRERVSNFESLTFKNQKPELIRVVNFEDKIVIGYIIPNKKEFKLYSFYK